MIIKAPALNREETATNENIVEIVRRLKGKEQPFAILEKNATSFIQTLWTPQGYILAYQENDLEHIYRARELVSQTDAIWALQSYLKGDVFWKAQFAFEHKTVDNLTNLAYKVGTIAGKIIKFIRGK